MAFDINTMHAPSGPVTISSVLICTVELKAETIDSIRNACIAAAVNKAYELWGAEQKLTVRDINGTDMSYTNNIFTETSNATVNQWNAMAFGAFTISTATVIGIYGVKLDYKPDATILRLPISGVRFDVGGSRVAQWHVQTLDQPEHAAGTAPFVPLAGVTRSPIIVGEDITVTIYEYTVTASTVYIPVWLGVTVEKQGVTLKP